jgi:hypothetical protein
MAPSRKTFGMRRTWSVSSTTSTPAILGLPATACAVGLATARRAPSNATTAPETPQKATKLRESYNLAQNGEYRAGKETAIQNCYWQRKRRRVFEQKIISFKSHITLPTLAHYPSIAVKTITPSTQSSGKALAGSRQSTKRPRGAGSTRNAPAHAQTVVQRGGG